MFLFVYFSVLLYFVFHKNKKKIKIQKQCVFVYIGTYVWPLKQGSLNFVSFVAYMSISMQN